METPNTTARRLATMDEVNAARALGAKVPPTCWDLVKHSAGDRILAEWTDAKGRRQYAYAPEVIAESNQRKFGELERFKEVLPTIREQVKADLHSLDTTTRAVAVIVSLIDSTGIRIGSTRYVRDGSFGASSLQRRHVEFSRTAQEAYLDFVGKHGKRHYLKVKGRDIVAALRAFHRSGKTDEAWVFPCSDSAVRRYLARWNVDAKMWRTYHATELARVALQKEGQPESLADAKRKISAAMKVVADFLGNSPSMAKNSYVDPVVIDRYMARVR
jgi:DNA topoisomerase I